MAIFSPPEVSFAGSALAAVNGRAWLVLLAMLATPMAPAIGAANTPPPVDLPIVDDWCASHSTQAQECEEFVGRLKADGRKAWKGDYQSQRNVAYCLGWGCDGLVVVNQLRGCAWRIVILGSGNPQIDRSDIGNAKLDCGRLSKPEQDVARGQADRIFREIYGRPPPPTSW